ncbi:hypothetical protein BC835DRAFT_1525082 [Cytidiella melzeri]|nr:hypothetical protein BC835DRAFT_1525082 [Cytidiella melzeri]
MAWKKTTKYIIAATETKRLKQVKRKDHGFRITRRMNHKAQWWQEGTFCLLKILGKPDVPGCTLMDKRPRWPGGRNQRELARNRLPGTRYDRDGLALEVVQRFVQSGFVDSGVKAIRELYSTSGPPNALAIRLCTRPSAVAKLEAKGLLLRVAVVLVNAVSIKAKAAKHRPARLHAETSAHSLARGGGDSTSTWNISHRRNCPRTSETHSGSDGARDCPMQRTLNRHVSPSHGGGDDYTAFAVSHYLSPHPYTSQGSMQLRALMRLTRGRREVDSPRQSYLDLAWATSVVAIASTSSPPSYSQAALHALQPHQIQRKKTLRQRLTEVVARIPVPITH